MIAPALLALLVAQQDPAFEAEPPPQPQVKQATEPTATPDAGQLPAEPVAHYTPEQVSRGRELFRARCATCHGEAGAGNGAAAAYLRPRPRDLTREPLKGGMGNEERSLRRALREGLPGSAMPRFAALPPDDRDALVAFMLSIRPEATPVLERAVLPEDRGREVYRRLECHQCHGVAGAGDGPAALGLAAPDGTPAFLTDLRLPRSYRMGAREEDLRRAIRDGVPGTPMPAYAEALEDGEDAALSAYLRSLWLQRLSSAE